MPDESRHNPFLILHKVLRFGHCRMIAELGTQDFLDETAAARVMLRLAQTLELNRATAEARHDAMLPALDANHIEAAAAACQDQLCHLSALAELQSLLRAFNVATPQRRPAAGRTLYRCYGLFAAADMGRMDCEETTLLSSLHQLLSDEDLRRIEERTLQNLPPDLLDGLLRLALPALLTAELEQLLAQLQRVLEPARFTALFEGTVRSLLAAKGAAAA